MSPAATILITAFLGVLLIASVFSIFGAIGGLADGDTDTFVWWVIVAVTGFTVFYFGCNAFVGALQVDA